MAYRKNVSDKDQSDIERAADHSAIRIHWFDGKTEQTGVTKSIPAYDLQAQGNSGGTSGNLIRQPAGTFGAYNDDYSRFESPGRGGPPSPTPHQYTPDSSFVFDIPTQTITEFIGPETAIDIPPTIGGVTVLRIGEYAFEGTGVIGEGITSVRIPACVTTIGEGVFYYCASLTELIVDSGNANYKAVDNVLFSKDGTLLVTYPMGKPDTSYVIPDTVVTIGLYSFDSLTTLTSVIIPSSVTSIGDGAFYYCSGLNSVTVLNGVTIIGNNAFDNCTGLTSFTIPSSVTIIGNNAFTSSGLTSLTIPDSVTTIGYGMAQFCVGLASVTIPDSITSLSDGMFYGCTGLSSVTIPDSVTSIGGNTFYGCTGLTNITIPASITSLGMNAFYDCTNLVSIYFEGNAPTAGANVFGLVPGTVYITYTATGFSTPPATWEGLVTSYYGYTPESAFTFNGVDTITRYTGTFAEISIPPTIGGLPVLILGSNSFSSRNMARVIIPDSVTIIGSSAFESCASLSSISFGTGLTTIRDSAFRFTALTDLVIPDSVTSIGNNSVRQCTSLVSATIGSRVATIGSNAFGGCTSLQNITIPSSVSNLGSGENVFDNCTSMTAINVDVGNATYSSIDGVLFNKLQTMLITCPSGRTGSYTIPNGVTGLGPYAFYTCGRLSSVSFSNSVTSLGFGDSSFVGCTALMNIFVDGSNPVYSDNEGVLFNKLQTTLALYPAGRTGNYVIPNGVTALANSSFRESKLTGVTIPNGVTSIGTYSFSGSSIVGVVIPVGITTISAYSFSACLALTSITMPSSVTTIGAFAFSGDSSLTSLYFEGNAPTVGSNAFYSVPGTVYYHVAATGFTNPWNGRPTATW